MVSVTVRASCMIRCSAIENCPELAETVVPVVRFLDIEDAT